MSANSFGTHFKFTSFGESHGAALGVVMDGIPAGLEIDTHLLKRALDRRRPGTSSLVSPRKERDIPEILSGVYDGKTLGTPLAVVIYNEDARSQDYQNLKFREGHADDLWLSKFGTADLRGGGRASGRETVARVIAGAFAEMLVKKISPSVEVLGWSDSIYDISLSQQDRNQLFEKIKNTPKTASVWIDEFPARFPSRENSSKVENLLSMARDEGKSYGGIASIFLTGVPPNLGQPVFLKLKSQLAAAMLSVGATLGFELGAGFDASFKEGTDFHNPDKEEGNFSRYGGIRGGISTGEDILLRVGFKPTSSVRDIAKKGRHDPCIVPRAIPVLQAMAWCLVADFLLWNKLSKLE